MFSSFSTGLSGGSSFQSNSFGSNLFGTPSSSTFGSFTSSEPVTDPFMKKEPEPEPEKVVKTPSRETQLFDESSIKKFANTLFEQLIKPELSTALDSASDYYKERIDDLEDRLSTFRRFMYAKGLEKSYEQWLTARIQSAKDDDDEPLSISLQHGMKDVEIMRD